MAIARLSVKVGKVGKAQPHAAYISRTGKYENRLEQGEILEATGTGNMPEWASDDAQAFWKAADTYERKNGSTYREHEIALPRELSPDQRHDLVNDWIKSEIGSNHAYQYAIHNPSAADGKEQPHAHLMFCERQNDGIARDPNQYFKRYNKKNPERGGAKKLNTGMKPADRREALTEQRERWQNLCNDHLKRAGHDEKIDMRSYEKQGIDKTPEPKMLPSEWQNSEQKKSIIDFRQIQKARQQEQAEIKQLIPNIQDEVDKYKRLDPDNIRTVLYQFVDKVKTEQKNQLSSLNQQIEILRKKEAEHQAEKPKESMLNNLFGKKKKEVWYWKNYQLQEAKKAAQDEYKAIQNKGIYGQAEKAFRQSHPDLADENERNRALAEMEDKIADQKREQQKAAEAEQKRLEREHLQRLEQEKAKQEREAKRKERELARQQRNRSRGRGDMER